jgi:hypothetical protein
MNILDPRFKYTNSASTDIRKTFARARREIRKAQGDAAAASQQRDRNVVVLTPGRKSAAA